MKICCSEQIYKLVLILFFGRNIYISEICVFSIPAILYPGHQTLFKDPEADPGFFFYWRLKLRLLCVHIYTCGKKKRNLKIPRGGGNPDGSNSHPGSAFEIKHRQVSYLYI